MIHKIYALVGNNTVYIGKTTARRVSAVYSRHICGACNATKNIFSKEGCKPRFYLLYVQELLPYEAYKYVLIYTRMFLDAGFEVLNSSRTQRRAMDLHGDTQKLAEVVFQRDLNKILSDTLVLKLTDADEKPAKTMSIPARTQANKKITVRVTEDEKERFDRFAKEMHLTQREALQVLISKEKQTDPSMPDWESDVYVRALLDAYREEIHTLNEVNQELQQKLRACRDGKKAAFQKIEERFKFVQQGIHRYFTFLRSNCSIPLQVNSGVYQNFEQRERYHYPQEPGFFLFRPQFILRGKRRYAAQFVLGVGDDEVLLKFRSYPKSRFVGVSLTNHRFSLQTSVWLVGCERAKDGAMDICCAFPLNVEFPYKGPEEYGSRKARNLADIIRELESYN